MRASRGTVPLAMTSRSREELPLKTAFAIMGFILMRRLLVEDIKFSDSMYASIICRISVGRNRPLTPAFDVTKIGESCSFGRYNFSSLSFWPTESSVDAALTVTALPPPPPLNSAPVVSFFGSLYGTKLVTASLLKSMSRTTHSPPSLSLDLRSFFLSKALMNFFAFFQFVFLI